MDQKVRQSYWFDGTSPGESLFDRSCLLVGWITSAAEINSEITCWSAGLSRPAGILVRESTTCSSFSWAVHTIYLDRRQAKLHV